MKNALKSLFAAALTAGALASQAAIVPIDSTSFVANAGLITFSEFAIGTTNPTYTASQYGGTGTAPGVSFGSYFMGQTLGTVTTCPAGVAIGGCVLGAPDPGLSLDLAAGGAFIAADTAHTGSPVLSGSPFLNGSIAMLFSTNQAGVSFDGGFFNAIGTTSVTAYDRDGNVLGVVTNPGTGIQFLGIGTSDRTAQIAGLLISLVAPEAAGFSIDNIRFSTIATASSSSGGTSSSGSTSSSSSSSGGTTSSSSSSGASSSQAPEPSSMALVGLALVGLGFMRRRKQQG